MLASLFANVPTWWAEFGVGPVATEQSDVAIMAGNYQPALLGQAKFMAYQAYLAMEAEEQGSAGPAIEALVLGFSTDEEDNYQILLLGQLKAIALPFYERFNERNYDVSKWVAVTSADYPYPWKDPATYTDDDMEMNYSPANVGQMKYLFSFGLEDWEIPSTLVVTASADQISGASVTLSGTITSTNFRSLSVNGKQIDSITGEGAFSFIQALEFEGENTLTVVLRDLSGNVITEELTVFRLTQAPTLLINSPSSSVFYTSNDQLSLSGVAGLTTETLLINGEVTPVDSEGHFSKLVPLVSGANSFNFVVTDSLGNTQTLTRQVMLDTSAPAINTPSVPLGGTGYTNNSTFSYSGALSEAGTLYINGAEVGLSSDDGYAFDQDVELVEGENAITIQTVDNYGNIATETVTVYLDLIPPALKVTTPAHGSYTNQPEVLVQATASDANGLASVTVNGVDMGSTSFEALVSLAEGNNVLTVVATDVAGNSTTQILQVIRDSVLPQFISLDPSEDVSVGTGSITVSGLLDDFTAWVTLNDGEPIYPEEGVFSAEFLLSAGLNSISIQAQDRAGNFVEQMVAVTFDSDAGSISLTSAPTYITTDRTSFTGTAKPGATLVVSGARNTVEVIANASTGDFTTGTVIVERDQINYLVFHATDTLGNQVSLAHTLISDTQAPTLSILSPSEGATVASGDLLVAGYVNDAHPSTISIDGGAAISVAADGYFETTLSVINNTTPTLEIIATDAAGLDSSPLNRSFIVSDAATLTPFISVLSPAYDAIVAESVPFDVTLLIENPAALTSLFVDGQDQLAAVNGNTLVVSGVTADLSGEFVITYVDSATPANLTTLTHRVIPSALTAPSTPIITTVTPSGYTQSHEVVLYGQLDPDTAYQITGGLVDVIEGVSAANGSFSQIVPLQLNQPNILTITAVAANGQTSDLVLPAIVQDTVAPTISNIVPSSGSTGLATNQAITLTFDESILPIPASALTFTQNGAALSCTLDYTLDDTVLTLTPAKDYAELATLSLTLPQTLTDRAGNAIDGIRTFTFTTEDTTAPEAPTLAAASTETYQSSILVSGTAESLSTVTITGGTETVVTTADASGNFSASVLLATGGNTLTATATDASGNVSTPSTSIVTVTRQVFSLASVVTTDQQADQNAIALDSAFTLTFNRKLDPSSVNGIALIGAGVGVIAADLNLAADSFSVTLTPRQALLHGITYELRVPLSVHDFEGNSLLAVASNHFTTIAANTLEAPVVTTVSPTSPTNAATISITGTAVVGATVSDGTVSTIADGLGQFTLAGVSLTTNTTNLIELTATLAGLTSAATTVSVIQDSTAPVITSVEPADGASDVSVSQALRVSFDAPVDVDSFKAGVSISPAVSGQWLFSTNLRYATFYADTELSAETEYTLTLTGVTDLAGNVLASVSTSFKTAAPLGSVDLLAAPIIDPLGFDRTISPTITLRGSAEPNTSLFVLGASKAVSTTVNSEGRFSVIVPLITDAENQLLAYVEAEDGTPGFPATVTLVHNSRQSGIRILSPQNGLEYNNRSVMITGAIDNPAEVEKVEVTYDTDAGSVTEEAALIGGFFARQVIFDNYALVLGEPTASSRTLIIDQTTGLDLYFYDATGALQSYHDIATGLTDSAEIAAVDQLITDLAAANRNDAQIIADAMAITQHSIDEGSRLVTVIATLTNGTQKSQTVDFSLYIQPEGGDTRAPLVTFLYPESGEVISEDIIETFLVVEEGVRLSTVDIGGVVAHQTVGNFFLIYAAPEAQGDNTFTACAMDYAGNESSAVVTVYFDSVGFDAPEVDAIDSVISDREVPVVTDRVLSLSGRAEAGSIIIVEGGLVPVRVVISPDATLDADGLAAWTVDVPLLDNTTNSLSVTASDAAGNVSDISTVVVTHDDTAPYPVASIPENEQVGVALNRSISITFSEPLDPATVDQNSVILSQSTDSPYNVNLSADGLTLEVVPSYSFERNDTVTVDLTTAIQDLNANALASAYRVSFNTAVYQTTLSGVVIDPEVKALQNIKVGILGTDIFQYTSSFGTFILDEVPLGEQTLYVDARPDDASGVPPQGDDREFGYLEFPVTINEGADNSLGRPIFMVDTDFSTATELSEHSGTLTFVDSLSDLDGFEIDYTAGSASFADGSDRGELTVTRIDPAHIPDRLPDGSIPHFLIEIGARDLSIDPVTPATIRFPNVYDLEAGEEVIVFYFSNGMADYQELVQQDGSNYVVDATGTFIEAAVLTESGFYGYIPANGDYDLTRAYLDGYVLNSNDDPLPNVSVNAIAGSTYVTTDANGYYRIPLPDVRVLQIQTFATLANTSDLAPDLIFPSEIVSVKTSGTTTIPPIVIDTFTLQGNLRYIDATGQKLPTNGDAVSIDGFISSVSLTTAQSVDLYVYRKLGDASYDSLPFMQTTSAAGLIDDTFAASFSMSFYGSDLDGSNESAPKPGDTIKIVAFDSRTGYYGEVDAIIPNPTDAFSANIDLRPPQLSVDVNRVFYIDSTRRRANVPHQGIVFTDDEFVEFKTTWRTADAIPLPRSELALSGRLRVNSIDYDSDYPFAVMGGEQFRVLEIREALYTSRLDVLQQETDVGTELLSISRNGSFREESLIPLQISTDSYGLSQSTSGTVDSALQTEMQINVIDFEIEEEGDDLALSGRATAGQVLTIGGATVTADANGFFQHTLANTSLTDDGLTLGLGSGPNTRYGASYTPEIASLDPARGSQGDTVTITGQYFSPAALDNKVAFNGAPAVVTAATETQLKVLVPDEASSGDVTVTVAGKVSNGVPFEFISVGINNGSFEHGSFRGFTLEGDGAVIGQLRALEPTDRLFMAFLDTSSNPVNGTSSLTTDRFTVPSTVPHLFFDLNLMGTAVFGSFDNYIDVYLIVDSDVAELLSVTGIDSSLERYTYSSLSGFNKGTGFQTVGLDLSAYAGTETEIQIQIVLKARGSLPSFIAGMRADDENPIDITKRQGTGLLLDNFRLSGSAGLVTAVEDSLLSLTSSGADAFILSAPASAVSAEARVIVSDQLSGVQYDTDASADGSFSITLPISATSDTGHYLINSATRNTADSPESDRLFSPSVPLSVDYDSL
jgi:hypothetical protein